MTGVSVGRLWQYPIKSMQGEEVDQILLGPGGVAGDRAYGFVDVETGRLASAKRPRRFGPLLDCRARFLAPPVVDGDSPPVEVTFPDGTVVRTDDDGGAGLTRQVADLLGREVRLVSTAPDGIALDELIPQMEGLGENAWRQCRTEPQTATATGSCRSRWRWPRQARCWTWPPCTCWPPAPCERMADAHPDGQWDPRRMRPNILIDDSAEPGDEDDWLGCDVHIGEEAVVHIVGPTPRCVMTTLSAARPAQGLQHTEDGRPRQHEGNGCSLGQFPCAGSYAEVVTPGVVRRGDPIRFERVQPRKGALAATIDMMSAALAAGK